MTAKTQRRRRMSVTYKAKLKAAQQGVRKIPLPGPGQLRPHVAHTHRA